MCAIWHRSAATAREVLLRLAAVRLAVPVEQLTIMDGVIRARADRTASVSYGELAAGQQFNMTLSATAPRKSARDSPMPGQPVPRLDIAAMVTGLEHVHNVRIPDMLHGWSCGRQRLAPPRAIDETSVRDVSGLVKVVIRNNFVGVVAEGSGRRVSRREAEGPWTAGGACRRRASSIPPCGTSSPHAISLW